MKFSDSRFLIKNTFLKNTFFAFFFAQQYHLRVLMTISKQYHPLHPLLKKGRYWKLFLIYTFFLLKNLFS